MRFAQSKTETTAQSPGCNAGKGPTSAYAPLNMLVVDPHLPAWLPELTLHDLRVSSAAQDQDGDVVNTSADVLTRDVEDRVGTL
jgi:hypothetical protein